MPRVQRFNSDQLDAIRKLSFREARELFHVGYTTWRRVKDDPTFVPVRPVDPRRSDEVAQAVLRAVREAPHLSARRLAAKLGLRAEAVHSILRTAGLNELNARLQYAGYQVETVRPLEVARLRRVLAAYPGSLTHQDYKTFGYLRGVYGAPQKRLGGYVVIDSLTGFASVYLCPEANGENAAAAFEKYCKTSPFAVDGLVLTDNGKDFLSEAFYQKVCVEHGCYHRTTRVNHPWSNGKVEALNKTLKYNCFPALGFAAEKDWAAVCAAVDGWMRWYNTTRAHYGWVNQGLPPLAFYNLWVKTPGAPYDKLVSLGLIRLDSEWTMRIMGGGPGNAGERPGGPRARGQDRSRDGLPFAFILEHRELKKLADGAEVPGLVELARGQKTHSIVLAK